MKIALQNGDGPTSTFVAGRFIPGIEALVIVVLVVAVILAVAAGIAIYIRKKRKEE